jgi:DNA-binding response OmpR family regulator
MPLLCAVTDSERATLRVLIAEDDSELAEVLATGLRRENMAVDIALSGDDAEEKLTATDYDVLVLDRDLPGVHGDDVCRQVVASGVATRILMLTAAASVGDLAKPFAFAELVARIRALGRRAHAALPPLLAYSDLLLDPSRLIAERSGQRLHLTPKEFSTLEVLLGAQGGVVTTEQLLERVWDENVDPFTNTVRTTMMRLRQKLGRPPLIRTVPGRGYQMASE